MDKLRRSQANLVCIGKEYVFHHVHEHFSFVRLEDVLKSLRRVEKIPNENAS